MVAAVAGSTVCLAVIGVLVLLLLLVVWLWRRESSLAGHYAGELVRLERSYQTRLVLLRIRCAPGQLHYPPVLVQELEVPGDKLHAILHELVQAGYVTGQSDQAGHYYYQLA
jgi:hypothetical protein